MNANRVGGACAIAGAVSLASGVYLHPSGADPNDAVAAFTEYAADSSWIAAHLVQLMGIGGMVAALLVLTEDVEASWGAGVARIAAGAAIASLALAAALQAVDGIALKRMVDAWAAASASQKEVAFHAAVVVRQIEIGLASMLSLSLGLTTTLFGLLLLGSDRYPKWLAALPIAGGVSTVAGGLAIAYTGFSGTAMMINMPGNALLLLWMLILGGFMWSNAGAEHGAAHFPADE